MRLVGPGRGDSVHLLCAWKEDTCLTAQDNYKAILQYFEIAFD